MFQCLPVKEMKDWSYQWIEKGRDWVENMQFASKDWYRQWQETKIEAAVCVLENLTKALKANIWIN